tara:strand:- start:176 stop:946 length:771 start_codon:yes stop_codon:yes gene_type:complete
MNNIFIFIRREWLIFIRDISFYMLFYFLLPTLIYFFLFIPFSNVFNEFKNSGMIYDYHAISSIIFICTCMVAFIIPLITVKRDKYDNQYLEYLSSANVNQFQYSGFIFIWAIICSYIEFIVSLSILIQLNNSVNIYTNQIMQFFIIILPAILLFSSLSLLLSNFIKNIESIIIVFLFLFMILGFGSGLFIPIDYFSEKYILLNKSYNFTYQLHGMFIQVLNNKTLGLGTFFIAFFVSGIFYGLHLLFLNWKSEAVK